MKKATIIVADDDAAIRLVVGETLRQEGWHVLEAVDSIELKKAILSGEGDLVITDVMMPGGNALDLLPAMIEARPKLPFLVMSAKNTLETAIKATRQGAQDYLPKPFDLDVLTRKVRELLNQNNTIADIPAPEIKVEDENLLIGSSSAMQTVYRIIARVVPTDLTVLITGESGTGKELAARALHNNGPRNAAAFVAVNMAAIPRDLIESELFGHERGAFTGALARSSGRFGQAQGGTLFLDEIGDMPLDAQTRLLRVLQEGEYHAVGGSKVIHANVRIMAATHQDLGELVRKGQFREDLYYRLNVVPLSLPPLRMRGDDIIELAEFFLKQASRSGLPPKTLAIDAATILKSYSWPGNVRELENLLQRVTALYASDEITGNILAGELPKLSDFSPHEKQHSTREQTPKNISVSLREHLDRYFAAHGNHIPPDGLYQRLLKEMERPLIEKCLEVTEGNQLKAAKLLGLNRNTLRKKITENNIQIP